MVLALRVIYSGGADYILVPKLGPGFEGFDNSHHVAGRKRQASMRGYRMLGCEFIADD